MSSHNTLASASPAVGPCSGGGRLGATRDPPRCRRRSHGARRGSRRNGGRPGRLPGPPDFGPNVLVFDPSMPTSRIQAQVDAISARQIDNEMGTERYALLFKPGTYGTASPPDLPGRLLHGGGRPRREPDRRHHQRSCRRLQSLPAGAHRAHPEATYCVALNNFWRSLSNLTMNVTHAANMTDCRKTGNFWAASQASPMRRVNVNGNLTLMDYCTDGPQWASADSWPLEDRQRGQRLPAAVPGPQHKAGPGRTAAGTRCSRACRRSGPTNFGQTITDPGTGKPTQDYHPAHYSGEPGEALSVRGFRRPVPGLRASRPDQLLGYDLADRPYSRCVHSGLGVLPGEADRFGADHQHPARPGQEDLILTPGVYDIEQTITINRADAIVLGLGLATLDGRERRGATHGG